MSFWTAHGYLGGLFFILFLLILPRLTMFLSLALTVGVVAWIVEPFGLVGFAAFLTAIIGWVTWFLVPRFLVAAIATALYWNTNPVLVVGAWIFAFSILRAKVETAEKRAHQRQEEYEEADRDAEEKPKKKKSAFGAKTGQGHKRRPAHSAGQRAQEWWDVLGVSPSASVDVVKAAYRSMAKATHPDSAPDGKGDVERFRRASEAYRKGLTRNGK